MPLSTASPASLSFSATSTAGLGRSAPSDPDREIRCAGGFDDSATGAAGDDRTAHRTTRSRAAPVRAASVVSEDGATATRARRALAGLACGLGRSAREAAMGSV